MNALEKSSPKQNPSNSQPASNGAFFDLDFFNKPSSETLKPVSVAQTSKSATNDDLMVDISINAASSTNTTKTNGLMDMLDLGVPVAQTKSKNTQSSVSKDPIDSLLNKPDSKSNQMKNEVKPLTDIFITLPSVQPSTVPSVTAFEEQGGLSVVLHFCKNKPRPDVNVIVVSTTSKSSSPITEYKFQAVVPKVRCDLYVL